MHQKNEILLYKITGVLYSIPPKNYHLITHSLSRENANIFERCHCVKHPLELNLQSQQLFFV